MTEIKRNINKPINAYALVAMMSPSGQGHLKNLLQNLKEDIGGGLWVMPPNALHITLFEIVQDKNYSDNPDNIFNKNADTYINKPAHILSAYKPIAVDFNEIFASPQAIIIKGNDDGSFGQIRKQILQSMDLPAGTALPPQIIHSSIARYTQEMPLDSVREVASKYTINFVEVVQEFRLIHSLISPLQKYEVIKTYPLI